MPIDWRSVESHYRLLIAVVGAIEGQKLDYKRIAALYGSGATESAIENHFRPIKREVAKLREEVDSGQRPSTPIKAAAKTTPRKGSADGDGIKTGRVTKVASTPRKRAGKVKVKDEEEEVEMGIPTTGAGQGGSEEVVVGGDSDGAKDEVDPA